MNKESHLKEALRRAKGVIEELQAKVNGEREPIAVIGVGCRFPAGERDAVGLRAFHDFLMEGRDSVGRPGPERLSWRLSGEEEGDPTLNRAAFLKRDPFAADCDFFKISPAEARLMDPQFHLMLECAWQAMEDAGLTPADAAGTDAAVFAGRSGTEFTFDLIAGDPAINEDPYTLTGNMGSSLSGRIAYFFDWLGPAVSVECACSTGLAAVVQAMEHLRSGRSALALAGAANLLLGPSPSRWLRAMGALSPGGVCRPFGAGADGFVRGEGAAALLLKPYSAAKRDGNRIIALLAGGALGADGRSAGFTVGSAKAQQLVMKKALADAGMKPADAAYVESHGTGTPVGDPIEAESLMEVYGRERPQDRPLLIGSVKGNLGHLEAAAGLAGLIKAIGAVKYGQIPPSLHAEELNPLIEWEAAPLELNRAPRPWPEGYAQRAAGVSAFAISGALAHVIVTEAPGAAFPEEAAPETDISLIISAFDEETLRRTAADCLEYLRKGIDFRAMTGAAQRRVHSPERLVVVASNSDEAIESLQSVLAGRIKRNAVRGRAEGEGGLLFMFSGQGSQLPGMGRELYGLYPGFKAVLDRCEAIAAPRLGHSLLEVMFSPEDPRLNRTQTTQAAIFAHQAALTALLDEHGCRPTAVMGHSIGEYAAAAAAGVFSLETGLDMVLTRGRLAAALEAEGGMAAVLGSEEELLEALKDFPGLGLIAFNGPGTATVAGERKELAAALAEMRRRGLESRPLPVSQAFHCPLVEPLLKPWADHLRGLSFAPAAIPFLSTLYGGYVENPHQDWAEYFTEQTRRPVRFRQALMAAGETTVLEVGAGPLLTSYARRIRDDRLWLFSQNPGRDHRQYLTALAGLFSRGLAESLGNPYLGGPLEPSAMPPTVFNPKKLDIPGLNAPFQPPYAPAEGPSPAASSFNPKKLDIPGLKAPFQGPYAPAKGPSPAAASTTERMRSIRRVQGTALVQGEALGLAKKQCEGFKELCLMQIRQFRGESAQ